MKPESPWWRRFTLGQLALACFVAALLVVAGLALGRRVFRVDQTWEIVIRGGLQTGSPIAFGNVTVDATFPDLGRRITHEGRQFVFRQGEDRRKRWFPLPKAYTRYEIQWEKDGSFELNLSLISKRRPTRCRLTIKAPHFQSLVTASFALQRSYIGDLNLTGEVPEITLVGGPGLEEPDAELGTPGLAP